VGTAVPALRRSVPARDENLQAVAWRPVHGRTIDGRQLERITARLRP